MLIGLLSKYCIASSFFLMLY